MTNNTIATGNRHRQSATVALEVAAKSLVYATLCSCSLLCLLCLRHLLFVALLVYCSLALCRLAVSLSLSCRLLSPLSCLGITLFCRNPGSLSLQTSLPLLSLLYSAGIFSCSSLSLGFLPCQFGSTLPSCFGSSGSLAARLFLSTSLCLCHLHSDKFVNFGIEGSVFLSLVINDNLYCFLLFL